MRLFLSSENLGNYPDIFLKMIGQGKVALVHNAIDYWPDEDKETKAQEHLDQFSEQGFNPEKLDLREYFGQPEKLLDKLSDFSGVFVFGGNTFILRRAMAASGFDKAIKKLLKEDKIAYGGSSAGSCVVARTLEGVEKGDRPQPDDVPDNYPSKEIIWEGLGLVDFMIVPHYGSTWWGIEANATIKYLKEHNLPYRILKDGQVILINRDKEKFLK